jgi:hypothetical protein
MQQMYSCPNCRAPVAYGQPQCQNCKMVFNWQVPQSQSQDQTQDSDDQPGLRQRIMDHKGTIAKIAIALAIVAALIGAGIALQGEISKWFAAPVVASFDTSSPTITAGQEAILQWNVIGADSVSISPGIGTVPSSGTRKVSPETTTTYTVSGNKMSQSTRKSVTITVTGILPSISNFSSNTDSIIAGQSATLSWSVADAMSVSISPDVGTVSLSGTKGVSPTSTTTYKLTASNGAGNSTASTTVTVTISNVPVITAFGISPASIKSGEPSTLAWDVIGAKSISISQGIGGVAAKGSMLVKPAETSTYVLTASGDYGSVTKSVTVSVDTTNTTNTADTAITKTPPAINTFSASKNSITLGDNITLNWAVTRARTVSIGPDVGSVPSSGWTMVIPTATTTYKLSAVNTFGTETKETTVTVNTLTDGTVPLVKSFTAAPSTIPAGGTSSLSWEAKGFTILIINQGIGIPISKYSQPVSPAETTTYTLTAINSFGTDNATVTVTVGD